MKSFFSSSCFLLQIILVLLLLQQQHQETCSATAKKTECHPSHCGKFTNITYPFRLKGDPAPASCGLPEYELECVNNTILLLPLFPGQNYHVKAINYNNFTIRIADPGIEEGNCSSLPRYFLSATNFSGTYNASGYNTDPYEGIQYTLSRDSDSSIPPLFQHVVYMNCIKRVSDPVYVDTAPCSSHSKSKGHVYAIIGDLKVENLKPQCKIKVVTPIPIIQWAPVIQAQTFSYGDIHRMLEFGFEVSWTRGLCKERCGKPDCFLSETFDTLVCGCVSPLGFQVRCGTISKVRIFVEDIIVGIRKGLLNGMGIGTDYESQGNFDSKAQGISDSKLGLRIGRVTIKYVLPLYILLRFIIGLIIFFGKLIHMYRKRHTSIYENIEDFLQRNTLMPIRYSYKEIKNMTGGFKDKLGEGGYGQVYKGKLRSGPLVAIKMLSKPKANGQDFMSEVTTIGRIHHANVVQLIGFCVEESKRALVYEFMPNGSLDKYISSKQDGISLTYNQMYTISLGVARGIAYLHQGCDMQILHFDIKPHNILLDENFIPKVSDFGLAKLYPIDNSIVTLTAARGTIGYMAPELFYKNIGGVSYKADVYSFGMLLMEMENRRRNLNPYADRSSELFFPYWIYDQLVKEREIEMGEVANEENNNVKKMFIITLWCIQLRPNDRPSMTRVIEMLEGDVENITMPPKPSQYPDEIEINSDESISSDASSSMCFLVEAIEHPLLKDPSTG